VGASGQAPCFAPEAESLVYFHIKEEPKFKDLSDRQTASRSHYQPLILVNGGATRSACAWIRP